MNYFRLFLLFLFVPLSSPTVTQELTLCVSVDLTLSSFHFIFSLLFFQLFSVLYSLDPPI